MDGVIEEARIGDGLVADECAPDGYRNLVLLLVLSGTQTCHGQKQQASRKKSAHLSSDAKRDNWSLACDWKEAG
jgi:hypothetical protein